MDESATPSSERPKRILSSIMTALPDRYQIAIVQRHGGPAICEDLLRGTVAGTLAAEGVPEAEISLALTDDAEIHRINREFLEHDYPTDVISFALPIEDSLPANSANPPSSRIDGELVISVETAAREAAAQGWSLESEVILYVVHGLLHLCGYDDQIDAARRQMRNRERQIMSLLNVRGSDQDAGVSGESSESSRGRLV